MKAIVIRKHGGADVLDYEDVPTPEAGAGEVLIKLEAIGVNRFDLLVRNGNVPNATVEFPLVLGVEGAGTIAAIGDGVEGFSLGDRVAPVLTVSQGVCKEPVCYCAQGHDNICAKYDKLGHTRWGTYAEFVKVNQFGLLPLPDGLSFDDASTALVATATAWELAKKIDLRSEDTVLVNAAGGAVGSAAVQVARLAGARVIASAGSDEKLDRARQLGADVTINYQTHNLYDEVMAATGGRGVEVVLETVGGDILRQSLDALTYNGRLSTAGSIVPTETVIDMRRLMRKQNVLTGTHFAPKESIKEALRLLADGKIRPILAKSFPLKDARKAHELLESREFFGNIVLEV